MSYFKEHAPRLFNQGYEVLPIVVGEKRPAVSAWQSVDIDKATINKWNLENPGAGVGIRLGKVCAIDVDVYDEGVANQLREFYDLMGYVYRVGQPPKFLVPFQAATTFTKKKVMYEDLFGDRHAVELLGKGQQFVAYADHPTTGKPFTWSDKLVSRETLPVLTESMLTDVFDLFRQAAEAEGWKKIQDTLSKEAPDSCDVENVGSIEHIKLPLDLDDDDIKKILQQLDASDYDQWVRIGAALHHQYAGSDAGRQRYIEWSRTTSRDNFSKLGCIRKWTSFSESRPGAITFASLLKETGYQKPISLNGVEKLDVRQDQESSKRVTADTIPAESDTLETFLQRYAFVPQGNLVHDQERPVDSALIDIAAFRNLTANCRVEVDAPITKTNPDGTKLEPLHKFWLCNERRLTVEGERYDPAEHTRLVQTDDGRLWLNTAHFPEHQMLEGNGASMKRIRLFGEHLKYLMPIESERKWFWQWLAFNVQRPADRCKVTPLHISLPHGTGRGFVVKAIEALLGSWNVNKATMSELCGEGSKGQYHDYFSKSLVCCIEEVYEGGKRYQISDTIRDKLTEDRLNVNLKYGGKGTMDVHTNFFWMSNHNDAVVVPHVDRRIFVIQGPNKVKPLEYYDRLYDWLKDKDNIAALWFYLKDMDISAFNWKTADMTPAKMTMIQYNYTATEEIFQEFIENPPYPFMSLPQIVAYINNDSLKQGVMVPMEEAQIRKLLQKLSPTALDIRPLVNGTRHRPWVLDKSAKQTMESVRQSLSAAEDALQSQEF